MRHISDFFALTWYNSLESMRKPKKTCQNNKNVPKIAILSLILSMIFIIWKYRDIAHFGRMARTLMEHILRTEFARDKR